MTVFFAPDDFAAYREILSRRCQRHGVAIWAYCLLPNHVHLIAAPEAARSLAFALGESHREYAVRIHRRESWSGHLWQQRFYSCPLDQRHLVAALRYVLQNPVRAGLAADALSWPWSSARAHCRAGEDSLVTPGPLADLSLPWSELLATPNSADELVALRRSTSAGFWREGPEEPLAADSSRSRPI